MATSPGLRIALSNDGVSIWNAELFSGGNESDLRVFLASAFAVKEVEGVELRRNVGLGRIQFPAALNPVAVWRKLGRALRGFDVSPEPGTDGNVSGLAVDAGLVYLDMPGERPLQVNRIGRVLSTWRVRGFGPNALRLSHPILRNRRDILFRLEEELSEVSGVQGFRSNALTGALSLRFDSGTTPERIVRGLERAWPRLLDGLDGPPSRKRLFASIGLTGLAYVGQYVVPGLRPLAVAGVVLYSAPNAINAAKQLRQGEVGLPTLYTTGLALMLVSGLPFTASLMALLMQAWPQLARRKIVLSQRQLFAGARQRTGWARRLREGHEEEVDGADLAVGDVVVVRAGETIPVDGVVESGRSTIAPDAAFGGTRVEARGKGDAVSAGSVVLDGFLTIRVERAGADTTASFVASLLPRAPLPALLSSHEAERVANRNVKPTLVLAALTLLATNRMAPAQAIIRPDYATGPRLSAQLCVLRGLAEGFQRGILFKSPRALDRLAGLERVVLDASAGIGRRSLRVARVEAIEGVSPDLIAACALFAHSLATDEVRRAVSAFSAKRGAGPIVANAVDRLGDRTRCRDHLGHTLDVATAAYLEAASIEAPRWFHTVLVPRSAAAPAPVEESASGDASAPRFWVLRDDQVIGSVLFARTGPMVGAELVLALAAQNRDAQIAYLSRTGDDTSRELARRLGIEIVDDDSGLRRQVGAALWVGDGTDARARSALVASAVSVSVAPLSRSRDDAADILLPQKGLSGLLDLIALGRAHRANLAADSRTVYAANLVGASGGLLANFTALHAGLFSNFGTAAIYGRHALALNRLTAIAKERRANVERLVHRWQRRAEGGAS